MGRQTKANIHQAIYRVFADAWNSSTPFSAVAHWCLQVKETSDWSSDDIDQVADTVMRMVALLQPRPLGRRCTAEPTAVVWQPDWEAAERLATNGPEPSLSASLASVSRACNVYAFADEAAG